MNQDLYDAIVTLLPDTYKGKDNWITTSKLKEALEEPEEHREHYEYVCFQAHKELTKLFYDYITIYMHKVLIAGQEHEETIFGQLLFEYNSGQI